MCVFFFFFFFFFLRKENERFFFFFKIVLNSFLDAYIHNIAALFFPVKIIGQCPPSKYDPSTSPDDGTRTHPCWLVLLRALASPIPNHHLRLMMPTTTSKCYSVQQNPTPTPTPTPTQATWPPFRNWMISHPNHSCSSPSVKQPETMISQSEPLQKKMRSERTQPQQQ